MQLDPDATPRHQILAELYQLSGPESYDKAVKEYRHLIKIDAGPGPDGGLHEDAAPPVHGDAAVRPRLVRGVGDGLPAQGRSRGAAVLRAVPAQGLRRARKARLTEELWQRTSTTPTRTASSRTSSRPSARRSPRRAPRSTRTGASSARTSATSPTDQLLFSKVFNYVNQVLGVPQPELYLRPESPGELDLANAREKAQLIPSFVVGSSLLQGRPEKELAYVVGKKLTLHAPRSLRPLADRRADGRRAEGRLPGGAEAGAARSSR